MYALRKDLFVLQYYSLCQISKDKILVLSTQGSVQSINEVGETGNADSLPTS